LCVRACGVGRSLRAEGSTPPSFPFPESEERASYDVQVRLCRSGVAGSSSALALAPRAFGCRRHRLRCWPRASRQHPDAPDDHFANCIIRQLVSLKYSTPLLQLALVHCHCRELRTHCHGVDACSMRRVKRRRQASRVWCSRVGYTFSGRAGSRQWPCRSACIQVRQIHGRTRPELTSTESRAS